MDEEKSSKSGVDISTKIRNFDGTKYLDWKESITMYLMTKGLTYILSPKPTLTPLTVSQVPKGSTKVQGVGGMHEPAQPAYSKG